MEPLHAAVRGKAPYRLDLRDLPAPEPLLRLLDSLDYAGDHEGPHVFLLREPPPRLFTLLRLDGWSFRTRPVKDGCEVTVARQFSPP